MTNPTKWQRLSREAIHKTLKTMGIKLKYQKFSKEQNLAIEKAIAASYPFGERKNHCYVIWLKEVNRILIDIGVRTIETKQYRKQLVDDPRQVRFL